VRRPLGSAGAAAPRKDGIARPLAIRNIFNDVLAVLLASSKYRKESANQPMQNWRIAANALACISAHIF
jgi:hypothetical protein